MLDACRMRLLRHLGKILDLDEREMYTAHIRIDYPLCGQVGPNAMPLLLAALAQKGRWIVAYQGASKNRRFFNPHGYRALRQRLP